MIDLLHALTPEHIHVGYDPDTGFAVHVPRAHFERGVNLVGAVGSGKTDFVVEFLRAMAFSAAAWCYLDFAGSGFAAAARFDALAATLLGLGVEALYADTVREAAGIAGRFMRRHADVTVGEDDPPVRLNILRRLRRKDGRRETPQRVAGRFADVWSTQFAKDADIRVRFAKWCTVAAGLLSAADRPITEYHLLFEDAVYRGFLRRAQAAAKTADDPFVREQWQILETQFLALAKNPGERLNRAQLEELGSLHNSLGPLRCGPLAAFFGGNENLQLEEVSYGDRRLYLTTTALPNLQHRKFVHRAVWAALDGLIHEIGQDEERPVGFLVFDEIAPLTEAHFDSFAQLRNHKFSPWILPQTHEAQFELMGMAAAPAILEQTTRYAIYWRPETEAFARRIATRGPIPDYQEEIVTLVSRSTGWSHSRAGSAAASWVTSFDPDTTRPETRSLSDSLSGQRMAPATSSAHAAGRPGRSRAPRLTACSTNTRQPLTCPRIARTSTASGTPSPCISPRSAGRQRTCSIGWVTATLNPRWSTSASPTSAPSCCTKPCTVLTASPARGTDEARLPERTFSRKNVNVGGGPLPQNFRRRD